MHNYLGNLKIQKEEKKFPEISGEFILLIDTREVKTKKDRSYIYEQLLSNKIKCEKRALPLGDVAWIYRFPTRLKKVNKHREYVINFIVERKKADDLASSIVDGRYLEQKQRLQESGIKNIIYIVEGDPSSQCRVFEIALRSAVTRTKVVSGFNVFRVKTIEVITSFCLIFTRKP